MLKSPFVVHPKSCRVCCPFDPEAEQTFDPFSVPCLDELFVNEDACRGEREGSSVVETYRNYVKFFRETFLAPLRKDEEKWHKIEEGRKAGETELF